MKDLLTIDQLGADGILGRCLDADRVVEKAPYQGLLLSFKAPRPDLLHL